MKTSELLKVIKEAGCFLDRHGRRHDRWKNPKTGKTQWVPRHAAEVKKGLAEAILKELVGE
jgi:predicted RNA binding protein YcfA (HicA-like mRNA interferase family)